MALTHHLIVDTYALEKSHSQAPARALAKSADHTPTQAPTKRGASRHVALQDLTEAQALQLAKDRLGRGPALALLTQQNQQWGGGGTLIKRELALAAYHPSGGGPAQDDKNLQAGLALYTRVTGARAEVKDLSPAERVIIADLGHKSTERIATHSGSQNQGFSWRTKDLAAPMSDAEVAQLWSGTRDRPDQAGRGVLHQLKQPIDTHALGGSQVLASSQHRAQPAAPVRPESSPLPSAPFRLETSRVVSRHSPNDVKDVQWIQGRLEMIPAGGVYDPATEQAVRRFQKQNGLKADGIVGQQTRLALLRKEQDQRLHPEPDRIAERSVLHFPPPSTTPPPTETPLDRAVAGIWYSLKALVGDKDKARSQPLDTSLPKGLADGKSWGDPAKKQYPCHDPTGHITDVKRCLPGGAKPPDRIAKRLVDDFDLGANVDSGAPAGHDAGRDKAAAGGTWTAHARIGRLAPLLPGGFVDYSNIETPRAPAVPPVPDPKVVDAYLTALRKAAQQHTPPPPPPAGYPGRASDSFASTRVGMELQVSGGGVGYNGKPDYDPKGGPELVLGGKFSSGRRMCTR